MPSEFVTANKKALWKIAPWLARRLFRTSDQEFSIGIYSGPSPTELTTSDQVSNPVLTKNDISDVPASFVADPFLYRADDNWFMFFELLNLLTWRGEIGVATSKDGFSWDYQQVVLREPYHLSYPYVFESEGEIYMLPETAGAKSVRLYKAEEFPRVWSHEATLLEGNRFVDSSIFRFESKWWLLTESGLEMNSPILRLFFSDELRGPWVEHPQSPISTLDAKISRPAGRVTIVDGRPIRFAQKIFPTYGSEVRALEIIELSETSYVERLTQDEALLGPGKYDWNRDGMHHIDPHQLPDGNWIASVDGVRNNFSDSPQENTTEDQRDDLVAHYPETALPKAR